MAYENEPKALRVLLREYDKVQADINTCQFKIRVQQEDLERLETEREQLQRALVVLRTPTDDQPVTESPSNDTPEVSPTEPA